MSAKTPSEASDTEGVTPGERAGLEADAPRRGGGGSTTATIAITQRELSSLFYYPIAYVVGCLFLVGTGVYFVEQSLVGGHEASMRSLFEWMAFLLVLALPLLTMRSIAEEFASDTIETLMTAPVTDTSVVLGKFFGTLLFFIALLVTTLLHVVLMSIYADPVPAVIVTGYLGLILLGALFIAVGLFASCCTRHQLLAALIAVAVLSVFTFLADQFAEHAGAAWQRQVCSYLNVLGHFSDFSKGMIDSKSIVFFVSGTGFFLFLAIKVLESRRWR